MFLMPACFVLAEAFISENNPEPRE